MADSSPRLWDEGFAEHEHQQILRQATTTTAEDRFHWLLRMIRLFRRQIEAARRANPKRYV